MPYAMQAFESSWHPRITEVTRFRICSKPAEGKKAGGHLGESLTACPMLTGAGVILGALARAAGSRLLSWRRDTAEFRPRLDDFRLVLLRES